MAISAEQEPISGPDKHYNKKYNFPSDDQLEERRIEVQQLQLTDNNIHIEISESGLFWENLNFNINRRTVEIILNIFNINIYTLYKKYFKNFKI